MVVKSAREVLEKSIWKFQCHRTAKVASCDRCSGTGFVYREVCVSYHNGEYDSVAEACENCGGYGRVVQIDYRIYTSFAGWANAESETLPGLPETVDSCLNGKMSDHSTVIDLNGTWL